MFPFILPPLVDLPNWDALQFCASALLMRIARHLAPCFSDLMPKYPSSVFFSLKTPVVQLGYCGLLQRAQRAQKRVVSLSLVQMHAGGWGYWIANTSGSWYGVLAFGNGVTRSLTASLTRKSLQSILSDRISLGATLV